MIERIVTDNGACYRSKVFAEAVLPARQQRITPYTPPPDFLWFSRPESHLYIS